ncbi:MAG: hypothetical protein HC842_03860, partial [Cytophagales bacterium]|nr:hypothetical protein [Cytophagales bacterium]
EVRAVVFPQGEDPDSYSRRVGSQAFQAFLQSQAQDLVTFKAKLLNAESADDPIRRAETIKEIVRTVALVPDMLRRESYIRHAAQLMAADEALLVSELNKNLLLKAQEQRKARERAAQTTTVDLPELEILDQPIAKQEPAVQEIGPAERQKLQEKESLRLLLNYGFHEVEQDFRLFQYILSELDEVELETPVYRRILGIYKEKISEGQVPDTKYFIDHYDGDEIKAAVVELYTNPWEISENWEAKYHIYVPHESEVSGAYGLFQHRAAQAPPAAAAHPRQPTETTKNP